MASWAERVYWRSPAWLQQVAVASWGTCWYFRRYGVHFRRFAREFREHDHWSAEQYLGYQEQRLARILDAAWDSPYYREVFSSAGVARTMDPLDILARLPILSKETARRRAKDLCTTSRFPRGTTIGNTSGSTGTPLIVYYTREYHELQSAVSEVRNLNVGGANYRTRRFMCGGRKVCRFDQTKPPFWRYSPIENVAYASAYHLSEEYLRHYVRLLRSFRPNLVMGYPSALSTIARYAIDQNEAIPPATMAVTTSETLDSESRRLIEAAWQCRLFDRYGAAEGCVFAGQCEYGRYHVSPELGIVEIVNSRGENCAPGEAGEVVCTGLHNAIQPLIRYRIGDMASWATDQHCRCGRNTPVLEGLLGRIDDMLYTRDGRRVGRIDHIFKGAQNVKEAQVRQDRLDRFVVHVVPAPGFSGDDARRIRENLRLHVGDVEIHVEPVPSIERTASGKFRAVVCALPEDQREQLRKGRRAA